MKGDAMLGHWLGRAASRPGELNGNGKEVMYWRQKGGRVDISWQVVRSTARLRLIASEAIWCASLRAGDTVTDRHSIHCVHYLFEKAPGCTEKGDGVLASRGRRDGGERCVVVDEQWLTVQRHRTIQFDGFIAEVDDIASLLFRNGKRGRKCEHVGWKRSKAFRATSSMASARRGDQPRAKIASPARSEPQASGSRRTVDCPSAFITMPCS